jgi:signal peptide peptidase SppA
VVQRPGNSLPGFLLQTPVLFKGSFAFYVCTVNKKVLLEALARPWFLEPQSAAYFASIVHKLFSGEPITEFEDAPTEFAFVVNAAGNRIGGIEDAADNGVAVINLQGAVMKYDYCGAPGTQSLMKALDQANNNPSVSAIVLQIDSPGGSVDGTQQFANAIKNSKKPVVAYANGMMASAAMWIGSAAKTRIASSNTDIIGSIGTMASWADYKGMYESKGIKLHEVYASDSTQKNIGFREASNGNYDPLIKSTLDPLNDQFISSVKANIPAVDQTVFNGAHYIATEAKKKGLVDKIGSFESAVKTAMQLGKESKTKQQHTMEVFQNILSAAKSESFEVIDGGFLLTEEQLNAIDDNIANKVTAINLATESNNRLKESVDELQSQFDGAVNANTELKVKIAELEAEVAQLKAGPAASLTSTTSEKDAIGAESVIGSDPVNAEAARLRAMRNSK